MTVELLTGNEAIARGAWENGVTVGVGYPGTPSTEILENFARYEGIHAEWAPNEKVALEVGIGASLAGARVLVAMKHVGVNVAADPLMTAAYTGVNGGLVLVSADDPGMHSSQNEQDNRFFARFARIPMLEPADSAEARDMAGLALEISEQFDLPVMLRTTTRVAHSWSFVQLRERVPAVLKEYRKDPQKWLMVPAYGRLRRRALQERLEKMQAYAENTPVNRILPGNGDVGVITSGISYQYVQEVLPGAPVLKLGLTFPLPAGLIRRFAAGVKRILVVEELDPYLEEYIRGLGLSVAGKEFFPASGEFNPALVRRGFAAAGVIAPAAPVTQTAGAPEEALPAAPGRPPVLCPGCPHRGVFYTLHKLKLLVTGDIGCYTLGGLPPLAGMDSCVCMGASIGMAHGAEMADEQRRGRTVAVIGDSTFLHSGITGLLNMVYNGGNGVVLILDNRTTAMTGHQDHPATGKNLMGQPAPAVDLEMLVRALGVGRVAVVDPLDLAAVTETINTELAAAGPSVIIARRPCALLKKESRPPVQVDTAVCTGCKSCLQLSCPAIAVAGKTAAVDPVACTGCGLCVQVCKFGALKTRPEGGEADA
ncbi:indolepyruvate ferredoxin oxidoreductase subunit alpha [Desulfotomaculum copahuensis]|uniref:Indolepyruvate oxidoreductase subunit IorA n=1 Tax=Desulfotomaculum copahuensis TaxID=1838280 RepID=A0A1B7LB93_9FIRM|nr:indolepyruvate ferredoxin oxidoreductase subunit alpha [Desulfotomaculum copahuensis]OAT79748.1 indolepyruvate ferredoxin oxidoreductase subunit alpha [Desulfotomaculum copahuensis]